MFKNLKVMTIAWGAAITIFIGLGVLLEVSYSPADDGPDQKNSADTHFTSTPASMDISQPTGMGNGSSINSKIKSSDGDEDNGLLRILPPPTFVVTQEDPDLIELGSSGVLPKRGADGKVSWKTYTSPIAVDDARPRIAIIITDMGLSKRQTSAAIEKLPPAVTFAFSPYSVGLNEWRNLSRSTGHEILMLVPMEPVNYPQSDAGKFSLLTNQDALDNIAQLHVIMGKMVGYVGMMNHMGSKFMTTQPNLRPILNEMNVRGLMFVDAKTTQFSKAGIIAQGIGLPRAINDIVIDEFTSETEILMRLKDLENSARARDTAVGIARNYPMTIKLLQKWIDGLANQGFQLVPITATVNRQPIRLSN